MRIIIALALMALPLTACETMPQDAASVYDQGSRDGEFCPPGHGPSGFC